MGANMADKKGSGFGFFMEPGFEVAASQTRDAAKWFLDLMRNLIVVALLFVLAQKSDRWYLTALAWVGFFAFWAYVSSYWNALAFRFPPTTNGWIKALIFLVAFIVVGVVTLALIGSLQTMVQEIARVQRQ
jgi:hypothetical protein